MTGIWKRGYCPLMPTQSVTLPAPLEEFVESQVYSGRYANATEVIGAGLRLLEEDEAIREMKKARLREAAQVGIDDIAAGIHRLLCG